MSEKQTDARSTKTLTTSNFKTEVIQSAQPVLVDFWAEWCAPCHVLTPTIESLSRQYDGTVKIAKLNVDDNQEIAAAYGIRSIPTVLVFKHGEVVNALIGVQAKERYEDALEQALAGE